MRAARRARRWRAARGFRQLVRTGSGAVLRERRNQRMRASRTMITRRRPGISREMPARCGLQNSFAADARLRRAAVAARGVLRSTWRLRCLVRWALIIGPGLGRGTRLLAGDGARRWAVRIPDFVGIDLRLAQAGEIVGDGFFVVQAEMLGVGANESFVEDAAGKLVEVFLFDGLEHARADLGDVGNVIERDIFFLARLAEFVSEFAHLEPVERLLARDDRIIIGQAARTRHSQESNEQVTWGVRPDPLFAAKTREKWGTRLVATLGRVRRLFLV